uniref:Uncharacterized protein n=1 Tax=Ixodes ricinus TaxID=34613 RepID=A0A6B0TY84_IXORI
MKPSRYWMRFVGRTGSPGVTALLSAASFLRATALAFFTSLISAAGAAGAGSFAISRPAVLELRLLPWSTASGFGAAFRRGAMSR